MMIKTMRACILLCTIFFVACSEAENSTSDNGRHDEAIVNAIETMIDVQNTLEVDRLDAILSPDFNRVAADVSTTNLDEFKAFLLSSHDMFSAYNMHIVDIATNSNGGFIRWRFTGVYIGPGSEDGGSDIDVTGLAHYTFEDGMLTDVFIGFNPGWFQAQISPDAELLVKP